MTRNAGSTVQFSLDEIRQRLESGEWRDETDEARIAAMTETELEASIANDPDADLPGIDWDEAELVIGGVKVPISIRLDRDILDFFKAHGPGYQKRINAVLRAYMTDRLRRRKRRAAP